MVDLSNFPSDVSTPINTPDLERDVQENSLTMPTVGDFNAPLVSEEVEPPPASRAVAPEIRSAIEAQPLRPEAPPSEINLLAQPPGFEERTDRETRQAIRERAARRQ